MDKNRNTKPAEDQGVIVAGADARARAKGEVKDDGKPRDVRDAPTENPPTGGESKGRRPRQSTMHAAVRPNYPGRRGRQDARGFPPPVL